MRKRSYRQRKAAQVRLLDLSGLGRVLAWGPIDFPDGGALVTCDPHC